MLDLEVKEFSVDSQLVDDLYRQDKIFLPDEDSEGQELRHIINGYAIIKDNCNSKHSALARYLGHGLWAPVKRGLKFNSIAPKDSRQLAFMDSLASKNILLSVCIGQAGSGKTLMSCAYALQEYMTQKRSIILSKPAVMVGASKAFGPVPGTADEKYAPYLASYEIILQKLGSSQGNTFFELMKSRGHLKFVPIELMRGCTFDNCTLILDECQNLLFNELNTLVSRLGENSKLILLGDLSQIDIRVPYRETGIYKLLNAPPFRDSSISSSVELVTQYRSPITQLAYEINQWVINQ